MLPVRAPEWIREKRLRLADLHEVKRVMREESRIEAAEGFTLRR